jgi:hypothetical protein
MIRGTIAVAVVLINFAGVARAQSTSYRKPNGTSAGSAVTQGNHTYFRNPNGTSAGSAVTQGNHTYFRNPNGTSAGSAYTPFGPGPRQTGSPRRR